MPTISLRLTDEQHRILHDWAYGSARSMQREIIFRLFAETSPASGSFEPTGRTAGSSKRAGRGHAAGGEPRRPTVTGAETPSPAMTRRPRSGRCQHGVRAGTYCEECGG